MRMMVMQIIIDSVSTLEHLSRIASGDIFMIIIGEDDRDADHDRQCPKYLSRIASGDIFMRLSNCSPPSSRLARPGHCSRLIWLNKPILGGGHLFRVIVLFLLRTFFLCLLKVIKTWLFARGDQAQGGVSLLSSRWRRCWQDYTCQQKKVNRNPLL